MTTVVTGASGFIGSVLVRKLLSQGRSVRAIVRSNLSGLQGLDIDIVKADIRDHDAIQKALNGAESVFHLAAEISVSGDHGGRGSAINVKGSENVARAALNTGVKHFVHCSSIHSFDLRDTNRVIDESTPRVGNKHPIYDRTKAQGESVIKRLVDDGLPAVFIHPSGVIGPGDHRPSRVGKLLLDLSTKKIPALISGGFNWVDVRDVCDGAIAAEQCGRIGESYILSGYWHSPRELALLADEITPVAPNAPEGNSASIGTPELVGEEWRQTWVYTQLSGVEARAVDYGPPVDQIEFITENGLTPWQTKVAEIKAQYPKS